ncbi:gliding motility-associated-like protein [Jejuia pallidilutea]|uniref:Gliding motility-associated-like protein n=1 Tax=Jejuia pallidilutea TaxID=504487 RepID=A0A362X780_9FLAO|nr:T9SS type B sorting domain-containing protein [Jejuia pallidilutea]PQV51596.1 gliding motility-associated-like protein [Jejuia pallidilutea]
MGITTNVYSKAFNASGKKLNPPPICTGLIYPANGETNIPVTITISWIRVSNTLGYKLTVGTTFGGNNILDNLDIGNAATYSFTNKLPENTTIYVRITPYNADGDAINCNVQSFTTGPDIPPPTCSTLLNPVLGATNVGITPTISWQPVATAAGYGLTIGTDPNNNDILYNEDVGNVTNYTLLEALPNGTTVYITIVPYNLAGNATGCNFSFFTTGATNLRPICTTLTEPRPESQLVPVNTNLVWEPVPGADGYIITLETFTNNIDILNRFDVGNTTVYDIPADLPENTTLYVIITPYNVYGETEDCTEQTFTTGLKDVIIPPKFFTPNNDGFNDYWIVPNPTNRIQQVNIYNRYGKLLKQLTDQTKGWDGKFNGFPMPSDDYWYLIIYIDGKSITGHFSLIR